MCQRDISQDFLHLLGAPRSLGVVRYSEGSQHTLSQPLTLRGMSLAQLWYIKLTTANFSGEYSCTWPWFLWIWFPVLISLVCFYSKLLELSRSNSWFVEMSESSQNVGTTLTGGAYKTFSVLLPLGCFYSRARYRASSHLRNSGTVPIAVAGLCVGPVRAGDAWAGIGCDKWRLLLEGYSHWVFQLSVLWGVRLKGWVIQWLGWFVRPFEDNLKMTYPHKICSLRRGIRILFFWTFTFASCCTTFLPSFSRLWIVVAISVLGLCSMKITN